MMRVKELSFSYGKNAILKNISLEIPTGKITTILGANGCGKSTLFSLMTKNLVPNAGAIYLQKKNINGMSLRDFARKVSIVHQYNTAGNDITVEQLIAMGRIPYQKFFHSKSEEDEQLLEWAISVTNLQNFRNREIGTLSGGQRQRVWIAMALAQNTKLLFLDEPTTYLDIRYQLEILELVKRLNTEFGITIIMVLHEINQAIHFSDRIIGLKDGYVALEGDPEEVITSETLLELYGVNLGVTLVQGHKYVLTA